jgi:uncharacterized membrane protein
VTGRDRPQPRPSGPSGPSGAAEPGGPARPGRPSRRAGDDRGTILVLTLGYLMIAIMLALVVTDVSAVYLARRALAADADGAALAAASQIDQRAVYSGADTGETLNLDDDVTAAVDDYSAVADPSGDTSLTGSLINPTTVRVVGSRTVRLPIVRLIGVHPVTVTASADAQTVIHP